MYRAYTNSDTSKIDVYINRPNNHVDVTVPSRTNTVIDVTASNVSGADKFFKFSQRVASDTWQVKHNLNKYPSVTVVDSAENVVVGDIEYIDENNLVITFTGGFVGTAYMN